MGYFPNGTAGMIYEDRYCDHCVHQNGPDGKSGCAVWLAHMVHNYKECNNEKSILHILIPRGKDGENQQCTMFRADEETKRAAIELAKYKLAMARK